MTVVVGTAGHIDHGKTSLLAALTGMDADRLPEEKRRGLTIDIGYARGAPDGGEVIDFVDVPGHDRLVGNMLVGAGEVDAAMLVVAADDGPRAQTLEHLGLLDALRVRSGVVVLTKTDLVDGARTEAVRNEVAALIAGTTLARAPIVPASSVSGAGLDQLKAALAVLRDEVMARQRGPHPEEPSMAIDRVFSIRGHGVVVTGSSRGAPFREGQRLLVQPDGLRARVRGIQVHDTAVEEGPGGGRVALNLSGVDRHQLRRGQVIIQGTSDIVASSRILVALYRPVTLSGRLRTEAWPPSDVTEARMHLGTDQTDADIGRGGRDGAMLADDVAVAMLRLTRSVAARAGDRFVLRQPHPADLLAGGVVLDPEPPRGPSRKRQTPERLAGLEGAVQRGESPAIEAALLQLHGIQQQGAQVRLADDVRAQIASDALVTVADFHTAYPERAGMALAELRVALAGALRRLATASSTDAAAATDAVLNGLTEEGSLLRDGDTIGLPGHQAPAPDPEVDRASARLVAMLDVPGPPALSVAAAEAGCPPAVLRELERDGRIVVVDDDLAWSREAYRSLTETAVALARSGPLAPAALRDATGTSRKYVMAMLEDLARRGILTRTPAGHVPGPRA